MEEDYPILRLLFGFFIGFILFIMLFIAPPLHFICVFIFFRLKKKYYNLIIDSIYKSILSIYIMIGAYAYTLFFMTFMGLFKKG